MTTEKSKIERIDTKCVHRICSGQVVISLAVAVKELVENALDAGATDISIRLKEFGSKKIEVIDNGEGIRVSDFEALCLKHYTSKIREFSDLENVMTFGFRGEALSSLCALGQMKVFTKHAKEHLAYELTYDSEGHLIDKTPCARTTGTTIQLENLFSTLPVRHKQFLSQLKKEYTRLLHAMTGYCLIARGVSISVCNTDDKGRRSDVLKKRPNITYKENILEIYGYKDTSKLMEFVQCTYPLPEEVIEDFRLKEISESQFDEISAEGYISSCTHGMGRSSNDRQFFYINSRPCDLPKLSKLINSIYHQYNANQSPVIILNITTPAQLVDVNLTPDKRTVLMHKEKLLLAKVKASLLAMFRQKATEFTVIGINSYKQTDMISFDSKNEARGAPVEKDAMEFNESVAKDETLELKEKEVASGKEFVQKKVLRSFDNVENKQSTSDAPITSKSLKDMFSFNKTESSKRSLSSSSSSVSKFQKKDSGERRVKSLASFGFGTSAKSDRSGSTCAGVDERRIEFKRQIEERMRKESIIDDTSDEPMEETFNGIKFSNREQCFDVEDCQAETGTTDNTKNENVRTSEMEDEPGLELFEPKYKTETPDKQGIIDANEKPDECNDVYVDDHPHRTVGVTKLSGWSEEMLAEAINKKKEQRNVTEIETASRFRARISPKDNTNAENELIREIDKQMFEQMSIVGQFNLGFIIARLDNDLFIIDQHASDEKFNFERLQATTVIDSQKLAVPQTLKLSAGNEQTVIEYLPIFEKNGFVIETDENLPSGQRLQLMAVPQSGNWSMGIQEIEELIFMLNDNSHPNLMNCRPSKVRSMFAMRACRRSVMIGTRLKCKDMKRLVSQLSSLEHPWNCPHGRPTMRHLFSLPTFPKNYEEHD